MLVLKASGKVIGAKLTNAERSALQIEVNKMIAESERAHIVETDAIVLYILRDQLGLGPKRLKEFYMSFGPAMAALLNRYEMGVTDLPWLATYKLKEDGIDVTQWYEEAKQMPLEFWDELK